MVLQRSDGDAALLDEVTASKACRREVSTVLICEVCGKIDKDVERRTNPYREDVDGVEEEIDVCPECYQELLNDI